VHDLAGRTVARLARGPFAAGVHDFAWDGTSGQGRRAPSGVYFVTVRALGETHTTRLVLLD
jgi:flagellar hook assembly protein FlgD